MVEKMECEVSVAKVLKYFSQPDNCLLALSDYRNIDIDDKIHADKKGDDHLRAIIQDRLEKYGFAVVRVGNPDPNRNDILDIASLLNLGKPFIPPYFKNFCDSIEVQHGINTISANQLDSPHTAFGTGKEQALHVDGTLQRIGDIKTTIVLCNTPSNAGGLSTIFNSTAAFAKLLHQRQNWAAAMLDGRALERFASHDRENPYVGPVFSFVDGGLVTRYSVDDVSSWENGFKNIKYLKNAYDFFKSLAYERSPFYKELLLERGEMLIMANSRISHGRTGYVDGGNSQRKMYRALFEKYPVHEK